MDESLDFRGTSVDRPARQQTLRATIGWSYDLLSPEHQGAFRRLAVFGGGADLDAITAVTITDAGPARPDALAVVADLVDASLILVTEDFDGEPRFAMLETVRAYALDQLATTAELDTVRELHAHHYLSIAQTLRPLLDGEQHLRARTRFKIEHDNFREALGWALQGDGAPVPSAARADLGLRLCTELNEFWFVSGYNSERRRWVEQAIELVSGSDSPQLAECLTMLAASLYTDRELDRSREFLKASVDVWRRLGDNSELGWPLSLWALIEKERGQPLAARSLYEAATSAAAEAGNNRHLVIAVGSFADLEADEHNYPMSLKLAGEAVATAEELGDPWFLLTARWHVAALLRRAGRVEEARTQLEALIPQSLALSELQTLVDLAVDYAAILADIGDLDRAARLLAASEAQRERLGVALENAQHAQISDTIAKCRVVLTPQEWDHAYESGLMDSMTDLLAQTNR